ncbi:MAG: hypothetical protein Q7U34_09790 [Anaerolineales bacterium]|nr:hypothetical protein [Anaerolineales bacterium]
MEIQLERVAPRWGHCPAGRFILTVNGRRYRQGRELADSAARRRIRRLGLNPESVGESPHLSGARGVGQVFCLQKRWFLE